MSDFVLTLGGVDFRSFEIPDEISGGGEQILGKHKYAGGDRSIDAFGPDPAPIVWEGVFRGADSEQRCQQLDILRASGQQIALSWSSYSYQVVISGFRFRYRKFWEIAYSITLEVVTDEQVAGAAAADDPESVIQGDMDDAADLSDEIGDPGLSSLVSDIFSAASTVSSIVAAPQSFLNSFSGEIGDALDYAERLVDGQDAALDAIPSLTSGFDPEDMASQLLSAAENSVGIGQCLAMTNTLGRLQRNVLDITG